MCDVPVRFTRLCDNNGRHAHSVQLPLSLLVRVRVYSCPLHRASAHYMAMA
jgi:hypothetical protein